MKAAQFFGRNDLRVLDVPAPSASDLKPDEVLVAIEWCGICGSDLHEYVAGPMVIPRADHPHALTNDTLPITMGHEFCGRILHVSASHPHLKKNDPVMVDPRLYCRSCTNCQSAKHSTNACAKWGFLGLSGGGGGGFSEVVKVDARMCYRLPESVPLEFAALIEPLAVAHHAVKCSGTTDFSKTPVLIVGGGPIGIAVVFVLRALGAKQVYVSEPTVTRRKQDAELADHVIDPLNEDVGEVVRSLTDGKGVDVVFDCAGIAKGLEAGMDALVYGGVYVNVAGWETPFVPPFMHLMLKELTIKGSMAYNDVDFKEVVQAFTEGKYKGVEKMVTGRIKIEEIVEKGFDELVKHKDNHIKIMVSSK